MNKRLLYILVIVGGLTLLYEAPLPAALAGGLAACAACLSLLAEEISIPAKSKHKLIRYVDLIHKTGSPCSPECQQYCIDNQGDADFSRRAKILDKLILKLRPEIE